MKMSNLNLPYMYVFIQSKSVLSFLLSPYAFSTVQECFATHRDMIMIIFVLLVEMFTELKRMVRESLYPVDIHFLDMS